MQAVTTISGSVGLLLRPDIDADTIIPNKFCIRVGRDGLSEGLFDFWRRQEPDFLLNRSRPTILVTGPNFGCGSSREQAAWALLDFGIRAIVAPSFGPIFQGNALRNGLIPVVLTEAELARLADEINAGTATATISLADCTIVAGPLQLSFSLPENRRLALMAGLDDVGITLGRTDVIEGFKQADRLKRPWAWLS